MLLWQEIAMVLAIAIINDVAKTIKLRQIRTLSIGGVHNLWLGVMLDQSSTLLPNSNTFLINCNSKKIVKLFTFSAIP